MNRIRLIIAITYIIYLMLFLALAGCQHESLITPIENGEEGEGGTEIIDPTCNEDTVYFENTILPILISNCAKSGCHDPATAEEGIVLNSYAAIMDSEVIRAFRPGNSDLYEAITEDDEDDRMPPAPAQRLEAAQIALINKWILQGAENNNCSDTQCDTRAVTFSGSIKNIIINKCLGCHSGAAAPPGIELSTIDGVREIAGSGALIGAIEHQNGFTPMPQGGAKLPKCDIDKIKIWIEGGMLDN